MEIGTYEAKTHLPKLLERVRCGERITITRRGKPIAELRPIASMDRTALHEALAKLDVSRARLRARGVKVSKDEIVSAIREGRH
jgi:prevent-host-death family protein